MNWLYKKILTLILVGTIAFSSVFSLNSLMISAESNASSDVAQNALTYPLPIIGGAEQEAAELKAAIAELPDVVPKEGSCVLYVSANGSGNGKTTETPASWDDMLSQLEEGNVDTVLFKRGDVFRIAEGIQFERDNMTFGAYGEGAKPKVLGSLKNYANEVWTQETSLGENYWSIPYNGNVGLILIDECMPGRKCFSADKMIAEFDFFNKDNKLILRSQKNPSQYSSIEIGFNSSLISVPCTEPRKSNGNTCKNITVSNIDFRYGSGHAIHFDRTENVTVSGCEISWIGGTKFNTDGSDETLMGNAIEFWRLAENIKVENNYISQIYDSGITFQGNMTFSDITFEGNLIEYTTMGIEYWDNNEAGGFGYDNFVIKDNIIRFSGYGWGSNKIGGAGRMGHLNAGWSPVVEGKDYDIIDVTIENNIFDTAYQSIFRIPRNDGDFTGYTITGNKYYQRSRAGSNSLGYGFSEVNPNSAFAIGVFENDKIKGETVANNQAELQEAVWAVDSDPALISWSYGNEGMVKLTETNIYGGNGRVNQTVALQPGTYVFQSYIDSNSVNNAGYNLQVLNNQGVEKQGEVTVDKKTNLHTAEFTVDTAGDYRIGFATNWAGKGDGAYFFNSKLYNKNNENENLLIDANNSYSWTIENQNGSALAKKSVAYDDYFATDIRRMLVIDNETNGGNGSFVQNFELKPGSYSFTSHIVGNANFIPFVIDTESYQQTYATSFDNTTNLYKIDFTVERAGTYQIGFKTEWLFAGQKAYIYDAVLCNANTPNTNLFVLPKNIFSWKLTNYNGSNFTLKSAVYDDRFEPKMLEITGDDSDTYFQIVPLRAGVTYHYSAYVDDGDNGNRIQPSIFNEDYTVTVEKTNYNYDVETKLQTADFTPTADGNYRFHIGPKDGWWGTALNWGTARLFNINLSANNSPINVLKDVNNAAGWFNNGAAGLVISSVPYDYRFNPDISMVQFNVTHEGTSYIYQDVNLAPGKYVYELNYEATTGDYVPNIWLMHKEEGWLVNLAALDNGAVLSAGINEKTGKYTIEFEVKEQFAAYYNYDTFNYLLTISNTNWCFENDLITVFDAKLYNVNDSSVNLLTSANSDRNWKSFSNDGCEITKKTTLYDYRFVPNVAKIAQVKSNVDWERLYLESSDISGLPAGNYVFEVYIEGVKNHPDGWRPDLDVTANYDGTNWAYIKENGLTQLGDVGGVTIISDEQGETGLHTLKITVKDNAQFKFGIITYAHLGDEILAFRPRLYVEGDESKTNLLESNNVDITKWNCTKCTMTSLVYDGRFGFDTDGDINGDETVNLLDLVRMKKYLAGINTSQMFMNNADVSGDKKITALDLICIRKLILYN